MGGDGSVKFVWLDVCYVNVDTACQRRVRNDRFFGKSIDRRVHFACNAFSDKLLLIFIAPNEVSR